MSDHKEHDKKQYSVDEILAEYGSGKYAKPKVVEFPQQAQKPSSAPKKAPSPQPEPPSEERRPPVQEAAPKAPARDEPIPEIRPASPFHGLAARLSTLRRRADHYADHMYDQAEPDEETVKAEKYIPGVDREEPPKAPPAKTPKPPKPRHSAEIPPDTPAAQLAARYQKGLKARRRRVSAAIVLSIPAIVLSLDLPFLTSAPGLEGTGLSMYQLRAWVLTALLAVIGGLCWEVLVRGVRSLIALRPRAEAIATLAWVFTLLDGLTAGHLEDRGGCLPCAAVTGLGLALGLWGIQLRRHGDRLSAKAADQSRSPYLVTLDENKWSGRPAYCKHSDTPVGFGSQLQMEDAGQRAYRIAAPLLLLGCLLCAVMASVGQGAPGRFVWAASACFTAASSYSALLAFGLPYRKLAARLFKVGAALAGWAGISRCRSGGIVMTDLDLFPPGSVQVAQVRVFGGVSTEKVIAYTATLLRVMDCGLTRPFHDLLRAQGAIYREVSGVRFHEGGVTGIIRNHEVIVGTASFMHLMDVALPQGLNIKNAVFCAISGELAGMFPLNYAMSTAVNPCLSALMHGGVAPILATRDPNLIPALLEQKFKLPVDRMEFPPVERRWELSQDDQEHDDTPVAVLCREGLTAYSDAVVGARRLRWAARCSLAFTLAGAAIGLALTFYLTSVGAYGSLTPLSFLIFMLAWLVPELLLANWVNQY